MMLPVLFGNIWSPFFSSDALNDVRLLDECVIAPYQTAAPPMRTTAAQRSRPAIAGRRTRASSTERIREPTTIGIAMYVLEQGETTTPADSTVMSAKRGPGRMRST